MEKKKISKIICNKLVDSIAEESATEVWLDFSKDLKYINNEKQLYFINKYDEVARMLNSIIEQPEKFCH